MYIPPGSNCGKSFSPKASFNQNRCQHTKCQHEGRLRVEVGGGSGPTLHIELFNGSGRSLRREAVENVGGETTLDWNLTQPPGGIYLLRMSDERGVKTVRVLR